MKDLFDLNHKFNRNMIRFVFVFICYFSLLSCFGAQDSTVNIVLSSVLEHNKVDSLKPKENNNGVGKALLGAGIVCSVIGTVFLVILFANAANNWDNQNQHFGASSN